LQLQLVRNAAVPGMLVSGERGRINTETAEDTERTEKKELNAETRRTRRKEVNGMERKRRAT